MTCAWRTLPIELVASAACAVRTTLGPEGDGDGRIIAAGSPKNIAANTHRSTRQYLEHVMNKQKSQGKFVLGEKCRVDKRSASTFLSWHGGCAALIHPTAF